MQPQKINLLLVHKFAYPDLFYGTHVWSPIELKVMWFQSLVMCPRVKTDFI